LIRWREQLLVGRIRRGDRAACAELVRTQHAGVFRWLVHLCGDQHTAEDLAQETFATAWMKIGTFGGSSSLATWLHRIAYCKFVDWHRREQRMNREGSEAIGLSRAATAAPSECAVAGEDAQRLHRAVAELSADDREVIVLHYFQCLSFRQVAEVLGMPPGTAKWRVSEALHRLRQLLNARSNDAREPGHVAEIAEAPAAAASTAPRAGGS